MKRRIRHPQISQLKKMNVLFLLLPAASWSVSIQFEPEFTLKEHQLCPIARRLTGNSAHSENCEKLRIKISASEESSGGYLTNKQEFIDQFIATAVGRSIFGLPPRVMESIISQGN